MTCALDLPNAKGSRAIGLGGGGTRAAREELHSPFSVLFFLTLPGCVFLIWTCLKCRKVVALAHLTQGLRRATKPSWTGIHPPAPHSLNACSVQAPVYMAGYNPEPVPGSSQPRK